MISANTIHICFENQCSGKGVAAERKSGVQR